MRIQSAAGIVLISAGLSAGAAFSQDQSFVLPPDTAPVSAPKKPVSFDLSAIDKTADPCTDFYQYACGNWLRSNPIPPTQTTWGRFNELSEYNQYSLNQELVAASERPKTPLQKKYGDFYAACMNTDVTDKLGAKPIAPELAAIEGFTDKTHIAQFDLMLEQRFGGGAFIGVGVGQDQKDASRQILQVGGGGGLTLPDRDYYLSEAPRFVKVRGQYVDNMVKTFVLLGDSEDKAKAEAADVLRIETAFANGQMTRVEMRDPANRYHIMTVAEVQGITPDFDWKVFLNGMGLGQAQSMNVSAPKSLKVTETEIENEPLPALKAYLRWHVVHGAATNLSQPFVDANFEFFQATLNGQKEQQPRWKRCTRMTDAALGEAVGQDWVRQNFPPDAKANMEKLVAALKTALDEDIRQLPWMSDETKQQAELKLAAFRDKIGYPANWRDYSKLEVRRDDLIGNLERNAIFERNRNLNRLGKPVDETEWGMTPPTVNAYYSPQMNDINFPAGILQPPFYDNKAEAAVNFGGIGVVIGHEMTHGFDDQGSKYGPTGSVKYNADGTMGSWFTPEDLKKFNERTSCIADEYSGFAVTPDQKLNGRLTLGENSADNGGIRISFRALQEVLARQNIDPTAKEADGYTPDQKFFITFGQVWCENQTEQAARNQAMTNPHSTGQWRTDGTVQNFDEFGKAFGCRVGQPMMPEKSCRVW